MIFHAVCNIALILIYAHPLKPFPPSNTADSRGEDAVLCTVRGNPLGYVEKLPTHFVLQLQNHPTSLQKHRPSDYKGNVQGGSNTLYKFIFYKKGKTTM